MIGSQINRLLKKHVVKNFSKMSSVTSLVKFYCVCFIVITAVSIYNINNYRSEKSFSLKCVLPPPPTYGWWSLLSRLTKSSGIPTGTILHVSCNDQYKLDGSNVTVCIDGRWYPEIGKCLKTCPTMSSTSMIKVRCSFDNRMMKTCNQATDNTQAHFTCAPFYEDERLTRMDAVCNNGKWSERMPECIPVCGRRKSKKVRPLIVNGTVADKGEFPWQVALYRNGVYICGGTLLHERLILTAAHCLSDNDGLPGRAESYRVAVGKYYRKYKHPSEDQHHQSSPVHAIFLPENYIGLANLYYGDIALIVPSKTFELSHTVQPICIDWTQEYEHGFLRQHEPVGVVSGWGYTIEYRNFSESLRSLEVPLVPREQCLEVISDYHDFVTEDKICAGFLNESKSVCNGDSGSGLVFHHNGRYYIVGVVSIAPRGSTENGGCNSQHFGFYTHVSKYITDFIWEYYVRFKPSRSHLTHHPVLSADPKLEIRLKSTSSATTPLQAILKKPTNTDGNCILPQHPNFGQWSLFGTSQIKFVPGMSVKTRTIMKMKCDKDYKLHGDVMVMCENGTWSSAMGQCLKTCPSIFNTSIMNIACFHKMGSLDNCIEPIDGTTAKYHCAPFYEDTKLMEHPLFCMDGVWSPSMPQCCPKCGRKIMTDPIYDENNKLKGEYPWMVAIYHKIHQKLTCSGSLLTEKIIVTAADCLAGFSDNSLADENYIIAAGKYSSRYDQDSKTTQFSEIQKVYTNEPRQPNDIAFVFVKTAFLMSFTVQPVCVDWAKKLTRSMEGYISGWGSPNGIERKSTQVEIVSIEECRRELQPRFITEEHMCIRYHLNDTSSCLTDRGGGLFIKFEHRYYIVGVMTDVARDKCHLKRYDLFTPVYDYMDAMMHEEDFLHHRLEDS